MHNKFWQNTKGNTATMFALAAVPLLLGAGVAIDMARSSNVQTILQGAADAAALAGASSGETNIAALQVIVDDFIASNKATDSLNGPAVVTPVLDTTNRTFSVKIEGKFKTSLMAIAGITEMNAGAFAEVGLASQALEVALVLDNTASMNASGRLPALKTAANALLDTLFDGLDASTYLKVGIVPFGDYVNIGMGNRSQNWMDVPDNYSTTAYSCWDSYPNATSYNCRDETVTSNNDGVITTSVQNVCDWNYGAPQSNCGNYTSNYSWNGCVGSRNSPMDASIANPITNKYPGVLNVGCPSEITDLTDDKADLETKINAMVGVGNTYIAPGVLWGWNLLADAKPYNTAKSKGWMASKGGRKAMIVMTDGANTKSAVYPGHENWDVAAANAKTLDVCTAAKADDVVIYTVAFMVTEAAALTNLQNCATSPANAFTADDPAALLQAFEDIASQLVAMRLTK